MTPFVFKASEIHIMNHENMYQYIISMIISVTKITEQNPISYHPIKSKNHCHHRNTVSLRWAETHQKSP